MGVVERFLAGMVGHDWHAVGACVADDVVRVGPYGDTYEGRDRYVEFISGLLPGLPGYSMAVDRVVYADGGVAFAQLRETVTVNGAPLETPETLVFDLDAGGCIRRVEIYIQRRDVR